MNCGVGDTIVFTSVALLDSSILLCYDDEIADDANFDDDYVCKNLDENIIVIVVDNSNNHVTC